MILGNGLVVGLNQTTSGGDIDVYLLIDDIPTRTKYKYRDISEDKNFQIIIDNAGSGTWYFFLFNFYFFKFFFYLYYFCFIFFTLLYIYKCLRFT